MLSGTPSNAARPCSTIKLKHPRLRSNYESLTPREQDVMRCVVAGMLNKQIGLKLGISEITVKAHRGKMMQKMKAESLADLVKTAVRLGLAPAKNPWHTTERQGKETS